MFAAVESVICS